MCWELRVICVVADSLVACRKWTSLVKPDTIPMPSTWPKVYSKISLRNVFTGVDLKRRNLSYKNRGFEHKKWRYLLEKWCTSLRFHSVTRQHFFKLEYAQLVSRATRQPSISFVMEGYRQINLETNDSENRLSLYADWLRIIYYCYLLSENWLDANSDTGACAVAIKTWYQVQDKWRKAIYIITKLPQASVSKRG